MEFCVPASVELYATDTGDLVFLYRTGHASGIGSVAVMGASIPLEHATSFAEDVKRSFGDHDDDGIVTVYGMELISQAVKTFSHKRPIAIACLKNVSEDGFSNEVTSIECIDGRWEYYCNWKED